MISSPCLYFPNAEIMSEYHDPSFWDAGDQTQSFLLARQALNQLSYIPSLIANSLIVSLRLVFVCLLQDSLKSSSF